MFNAKGEKADDQAVGRAAQGSNSASLS